MYELFVQLELRCTISDVSAKFPAAKFQFWDNAQRGFLEITSTRAEDLRPMNLALRKLQRGNDCTILQKKVNSEGELSALLTFEYKSKGSSVGLVSECGCFLIFPLVIVAGRKFLHILAFDKRSVRRLIQRFNAEGNATIEKERRINFDVSGLSSLMPLINPIADLTSKQVTALAMSMRHGYYELPRHTSTGKIANAVHVPRTTFQDHRKKAETKLMHALAPYILTHAQQS